MAGAVAGGRDGTREPGTVETESDDRQRVDFEWAPNRLNRRKKRSSTAADRPNAIATALAHHAG